MTKERPTSYYNYIFPIRSNTISAKDKVYAYKSDGKLSSVVKKAAYLPKTTYKSYKMSKKGYGKFDFEVQ